MALEILIRDNALILDYTTDYDFKWIDEKFENNQSLRLKKTFIIYKSLATLTEEKHYEFIIGALNGDFFIIPKDILETDYDVKISKDCEISIDYFIINNNTSLLKKIEKLAQHQIIIGDAENSIPKIEFEQIIASFPTPTEIGHYKDQRITNVISNYLDGVKDSRRAFENYLEKHNKSVSINDTESIKNFELDKFSFLLDRIKSMLNDSESYKESVWQDKILEIISILYPKYIKCFKEVTIKDYYTNPDKTKNRFLDLMLLDANGNIDVIEIKKPFENCVITNGTYRDNFTPMRELSGTIMQLEKYIFHLNKWGVTGERKLTDKYKDEIPNGMKIQITNPKGIIIMGRNNNLNESQLFDFEIIKRKYSNVMDIITYDDLIQRLENIISKFK